MLRNILILLSVFFTLFSKNLSAGFKQSNIITIRHLGLEEGLAAKQVNCGMQDSKGFIWFGTAHGLQRYDGKNFKLFTKEKNGLQGNNITSIHEDDHERLWIVYGVNGRVRQSAGDVDLIDLNSYKITSIQNQFGGQLPFDEKRIGFIRSNEKKELILIISSPIDEGKAVWFYSFKQGFKKIISSVDINYLNSSLVIFRNETAMFYNNRQTILLSLNGKVIRTNYDLTKADNLFPVGISATGFLYGATSYHNVQGKKFPRPLFMKLNDDGSVYPIAIQFFDKPFYTDYNDIYMQSFYDERSAKTLIYQFHHGLFLYDGEHYTRLEDSLDNKNRIDLNICDYFTTRDNQHWICTFDGVKIISVKPNHFVHILNSVSVKLPMKLDYQTRSIYQNNVGQIFINSWGGFFKATKNTAGEYEYAKMQIGDMSSQNGFYVDNSGLWGSSLNGNKLFRYDLSVKGMTEYKSDSLSLWAGIKTKSGHLLIGAMEGLGVLKEDHIERIKFCGRNVSPDCWVYQLFYSKDETLWAITDKGLYTIDSNDCIANHYAENSPEEKYKLPCSDLLFVHEDKEGVFWMATNGNGLYKWNRKKHTFQQYAVADGLSSNVLYSILEDDHGYLWISSEYGLMRFEKEHGVIKTYTTADGITDNEFNRVSYFKATDGRMFFGGLDGVNAFYPKDFLSDSSVFDVPLRIISFNQYDGEAGKLLDRTIELLRVNQISLNPNDKFFTIEFQLLDFEEGKQNYAYKIDGLDKDWNYINENSIRFSGLPYGKYTLLIKGQSHDGHWSVHELKIPIQVLTPFYKQWWFIALAFAFAVLLFMLFFRWRTLQLRNSKESLERTVNERTEQLKSSLGEKEVLLKEIHHRVKNNLQVISGLLELQEKNLSDKVARQALMEGRNRVRSVALIHQNLYQFENLSRIELRSFVEDLFRQISNVFEKNSNQISLQLDIPLTEIDIDTAVPLGLILNELLTNSFKYAINEKGCQIKMFMNVNEDADKIGRKFVFVYQDNGPGLPAGFDLKKSKTLGMLLINDLSKQIGGSMVYEYKNGSTFTVTFLDKDARKKND